jgi:hypothetical protein
MNKAVKPLITFGVLIGALGLPIAYADDDAYRYTATLNAEGKYCARIKVLDVSGERKKTVCRTIEKWQAKGYVVDQPKVVSNEPAASNAAE